MISNLQFILMILGFVCVSLAAANLSTPRIHIGWLGVALWLLSILILRTP